MGQRAAAVGEDEAAHCRLEWGRTHGVTGVTIILVVSHICMYIDMCCMTTAAPARERVSTIRVKHRGLSTVLYSVFGFY